MFYGVNVLVAAYAALWSDYLGNDMAYWVAFLCMNVSWWALWGEYRRGS